MDKIQTNMIGHGAVVMGIALLAGFGLAFSLVGGLEIIPGQMLAIPVPGDADGWARAHTGGLLNGLMLFAGAWIIGQLAMGPRMAFNIYWMFVGAAYANTIFYWCGLLAPNRALTFMGNEFGGPSLVGAVGLMPALIFAVVMLVAMFLIAVQAFSRRG